MFCTCRVNRFMLIIWSALGFAIGFSVLGQLADLAPAKTQTDPALWWTVCWMAIGAWAGAILSLLERQYKRLHLVLVGVAAFGGASHLVIPLLFDLLALGRQPYYPSAVITFALIGGIGSSILGWMVGGHRSLIGFLVAGMFSFGAGRVVDLTIRNGFLWLYGYTVPNAPVLPMSTAILLGIVAFFCFGAIAGAGYGLVSAYGQPNKRREVLLHQ
jgi:hypothetical protein